jgi:hypothetical protein
MKKLLTLDDRIKQDLEDLYNKGEIDGAVDLDGLVKKENEGIYWINKKEDGAFTPKEKKVVELLKSNSGISIEQLAVQAQMDVNSLNELLENLKKNKGYNDNIKEGISFATRALPVYTGGKRGAKTVMVMLNPGKGVKDSNKDLLIELKKRSMFTMLSKLCGGACPQVTSSNVNLTEDIENYNYFNAHYGDWDCNRHDNFDLKQAFFLRDWKDSGIDLSEDNLDYIIEKNKVKNKEDKEEVQKRKLEEKRKVLNDKQQLELVPYASRSFSSFADKGNIEVLCPYVYTLLHEIFSQPRKYVIFCSGLFDEVFKVYNEKGSKKYRVEFGEECKYQIIGEKLDKKTGQKKIFSTSCTPITIFNLEDKSSIKAIIANTFPSQALPNAYEKMAEYGKFCYVVYDSYNKFQGPINKFKDQKYQNILDAMTSWKSTINLNNPNIYAE